MRSRILVFDPVGKPLGEITANANRSWILNGYADAEFVVATNDAKAQPELLNFGNLIRIEHDTLPVWDGFIDTPREWTDKNIKCKAYNLEIVLDWRYGPVANYGLGPMPVREWSKWILMMVNSTYSDGLKIYEGVITNPDLHLGMNTGARLRTLFDMIAKKFGVDWSLSGGIDEGIFKVYMNLYNPTRGVVTNFTLDNSNTIPNTPLLKEDGPIYNHVTVYSEALEGGARNWETSIDLDSVAKYGLRATAEQAKGSGTADIGLKIAADYLLATYKEPRRMIAPQVINVGNTFANMAIGNVIHWRGTSVGFGGTQEDARIVGMEYDDATDRVTLVADLAYDEMTRKQFLYDWWSRNGRRI